MFNDLPDSLKDFELTIEQKLALESFRRSLSFKSVDDKDRLLCELARLVYVNSNALNMVRAQIEAETIKE